MKCITSKCLRLWSIYILCKNKYKNKIDLSLIYFKKIKDMSSNITKYLNDYISFFIKSHGDIKLEQKWFEEENQRIFKNCVKLLLEKKFKKDVRKEYERKIKPKKKRNAFIFFCINERQSVKNLYPTLNNKEIVKTLSEKWNEIKNDCNLIKRFKEMESKDQERYKNEMAEFEDGMKKKIRRSRKTQKKEVDDNAPKKNLSAYIYFCKDDRETLKTEEPSLSSKDIISKMAERWKILKDSDPEKYKRYCELAEADKSRFLNEFEEYKSTKPVTEELNEKKKSPSKRRKKKNDGNEEEIQENTQDNEQQQEDDGKKKKPNPYIKFCSEQRPIIKEQFPEMKQTQIISELGKRWKELSQEDKNKYA